MTIGDISQLVGGFLIVLSNVVQIKRIVKTKHVEDFSGWTLFIVLIAISMMEINAVEMFQLQGELACFITNTSALVCAITIVVLYVIYKEKNNDTKSGIRKSNEGSTYR